MSATINFSETVLDLPPFRLDSENVTLDNDVTTTIHVLRHPGASAIVAFLDSQTVVLVKQYRHAAGSYIWEIPAGTLDFLAEDPMACARRELQEETGYQCDRCEKIGQIMPAPGYSDEQLHVFMASGLTPAQQDLEQDEVLQVHAVQWETALTMIQTGEIVDAKTIAGLLLVQSIVSSQPEYGLLK